MYSLTILPENVIWTAGKYLGRDNGKFAGSELRERSRKATQLGYILVLMWVAENCMVFTDIIMLLFHYIEEQISNLQRNS
jgi:hypothetical protein